MNLRRMISSAALVMTLVSGMEVSYAPASGAAGRPNSPSVAAVGGPRTASTYLAGYQVSGLGPSFHATMTFRVPAVTCTATTEGVLVGIGSEEVFGAPTFFATVWVVCSGGGPLIQVNTQAGSDNDITAASIGDVLIMSVNQTPTTVTARVNDVTKGVVTKSSGDPTPDTAIMWGAFPFFSGALDPVPDFGAMKIGHPMLDNTELAALSPEKLVRKSGTTIQIKPSPLLANSSFRLLFMSH